MCGIFGYSSINADSVNKNAKKIIEKLFLLSESRGKEASGIALNDGHQINYIKTPFPASDLIKSSVFQNKLKEAISVSNPYKTFIGHSRLVTNGYENDSVNNQPIVKDNLLVVHNGIIVNHQAIWNKYHQETKLSELDSEIIPTLISHYVKLGYSFERALKILYEEIIGMASIAMLSAENQFLSLATNNGSLYYLFSNDGSEFVFASERYILNTLISKSDLLDFNIDNITQLNPNNAFLLNLNDNKFDLADFEKLAELNSIPSGNKLLSINAIVENVVSKKLLINNSLEHKLSTIPLAFLSEVNKRQLSIKNLKRCTNCLLPETFPYILFDVKGICNYCNHYSPLKFKGEKAFKENVYNFKASDKSKPDCLVPFSGGRDSSFALHYLKKELGLNPIAFSYDWGMLTDLARRNQSRMCSALGVEHILISADIRKKRANIKKNVSAWLKKPHLGTIPLFMAGDKQYFYYASVLMKQNNLKLSIMGENMLETTRFKSGFCGIKPSFDAANTYSLSLTDKLKMISFYSKEYLLNPAYINSSLIDTLDAFKSYYVMKHENINLFDYLPWDEQKVEEVLINQYDWETDPETKTTWRIGDGTAAFYNYIYYMVAGFTENDTFRSNQVREGLISRDLALAKIEEENQPRWESIQWYCNTIGIDWEDAIKTINKIKTLYKDEA